MKTYEHKPITNFPENLEETIEKHLEETWQLYKKFDKTVKEEETNSENDEKTKQPFIDFDCKEGFRTKNYAGFIQIGEEVIEIYPKVFENQKDVSSEIVLKHLFYWLSYSERWKLPFSAANFEPKEACNFPELIMWLMANHIYEIVSTQPMSMYQETTETLTMPKGRINFSNYVNNLAKGNWHLIDCDIEPFVFDNKVNRIIKYCTRLLQNRSKNNEIQLLLHNILFVLDEVEDLVCTERDLQNIALNPFFDDYVQIMFYCELILKQQLYGQKDYELSQWNLLFKMETVFEEFVAGFMKKHFSKEWKITSQKSKEYLATNAENLQNVFQMNIDIFIEHKTEKRKIIIDTKYKQRDKKTDAKKGVSQTDLYQVLSYAYRYACHEVWLLYPNCTDITENDVENNTKFDSFIISGANPEEIIIKAIDIPFWSITSFDKIEDYLKNQLDNSLAGTTLAVI
jgi:5-methylcytosine-specific restriction enzyme subunit McrC